MNIILFGISNEIIIVMGGIFWMRGGDSMKSKSIILILILVACIFAINRLTGNNRNELSELGTHVQNIKLEYKSKRGFGNDRFDIYSYSLE